MGECTKGYEDKQPEKIFKVIEIFVPGIINTDLISVTSSRLGIGIHLQ
jgi:hypothetical protein